MPFSCQLCISYVFAIIYSVEFFSHIGYTLNVIVSAGLLIGWLAPTYLDGSSPGWRPRPYEAVIAFALSVLAILFTQRWVPYERENFS